MRYWIAIFLSLLLLPSFVSCRLSRTSDFDFDLSEELIQRISEFDECLVHFLLDLYLQ